jgi:hypothetical protein
MKLDPPLLDTFPSYQARKEEDTPSTAVSHTTSIQGPLDCVTKVAPADWFAGPMTPLSERPATRAAS